MKSPNPVISIVTPSYNQGDFLEETIRSVIDQASSNHRLQYIIQDNCSDDTTCQVLLRYQNLEFPMVRIEADAGQADALNRGFRYSNGNILGWVNSDDVLLPGALEAVTQAFEDNPNVDVIYGDAYFMDRAGVILSKYPTVNFNSNLFLSTCFLSQPSVFFRRSIFEKVGGLRADLHYCLDYNLWLKFYQADASFYYLEKTLSATRVYGETKTATGGKKFADEILQMFLDEMGYVPDCWRLYSEYSKEKGSNSDYKLFKFIKASTTFLIAHPGTVTEVVPFLSHMVKHKIKKFLTIHRLPYGKHYSSLGNNN